MDRRTFLYSCSLAATTIMGGCEKQSEKGKQTIPRNVEIQKQNDIYEPFTQELKIPQEIDFEKIAKAKFNAQQSLAYIYRDKKTEVLTFQGDIPNPTIRIKNKDDFELDFTNSLEKSTIIH